MNATNIPPPNTDGSTVFAHLSLKIFIKNPTDSTDNVVSDTKTTTTILVQKFLSDHKLRI